MARVAAMTDTRREIVTRVWSRAERGAVIAAAQPLAEARPLAVFARNLIAQPSNCSSFVTRSRGSGLLELPVVRDAFAWFRGLFGGLLRGSLAARILRSAR